MTTKTVQIPRTLVNQLLHQAQLSPAQEVCGLVGRDQDDCVCYPIENVATDASVLFALNASEQLAAFKKMKEKGQELFAIYHSHPSSPPIPSEIDIEEANYSEALYLIISLNTKGVLEMRGFYLRDGTNEEVELII
ncbi:M67 family metallopeptidase [Methylophaga sp. OBS4]|uniref:M67 family metallopeptidase n=1 Tax=Methylophaga sp. OBS4 TaxID=2991935 RepID=UPI00225B9946|nr:M67 family metallopeptidase [Methylophaga sp. OBS4]MCX4187638.1 M67 family metallopeptidase [Methylophaga sp. OBS4]